jgi:hypothetical protein
VSVFHNYSESRFKPKTRGLWIPLDLSKGVVRLAIRPKHTRPEKQQERVTRGGSKQCSNILVLWFGCFFPGFLGGLVQSSFMRREQQLALLLILLLPVHQPETERHEACATKNKNTEQGEE